MKRILPILKEKYKPQRIILFGSLANGKVKEWSDIDLVIIKDTEERLVDRIGDVINLCDPKVGVDFFVYTPAEFKNLSEVEPFIQEEVMKKGNVIYERE